MPELKVTMTGEEQQLFASLMKVVQGQDQVDGGFAKNEKSSSDAARAAMRAAKEQQKQVREGSRLVDQLSKKNETLLQSYQRRKAAIEAAGEAGVKSETEVKVAVDQLKEAVRQEVAAERQAKEAADGSAKAAKEAAAARAEAIKKGTEQARELNGENVKLMTQYKKIKADITEAYKAGKISAGEYETSLQKLNTKYRNLGEGQNKAFGPSAVKQVATYAASVASIGAGIEFARKALAFYQEELDQAAAGSESLVDIRRSLRQVSQGDFDKLESLADSLTRFGLSRVEARQLVFDGRSQGFLDDAATVAAANPIIEVRDGSAFAGEFRKFFGGEGLTVEQAFNTALAGAAESQFNITQLLPQVRKAAQGNLAGTFESSDITAATSVLATNFAESTGDRLRGFGTKVSQTEELQGLNLLEAVKVLEGDSELRKTVLKDSQELNAVFAKLVERFDEIQAVDKTIEREQQTTGADGLLQKKIAEALDPNTASGQRELARIDAAAAEIQTEIRKEQLAAKEFRNRSFIERQAEQQTTAAGRFVSRIRNQTDALIFGSDLQENFDIQQRSVGLPGESPDDRRRQVRERFLPPEVTAESPQPAQQQGRPLWPFEAEAAARKNNRVLEQIQENTRQKPGQRPIVLGGIK